MTVERVRTAYRADNGGCRERGGLVGRLSEAALGVHR
jgi:hypothetical protein